MEGFRPREDGCGDGGSHCGVERKVGRCRRDSGRGVVHVVRVRPLRACRVVRLWGSNLEVAWRLKIIHYSMGKMIFYSSPF
jgi:hypothetical protein